MTFFSQARQTCRTTHFIRLCTILHATGFGQLPKFEDCKYSTELNKYCEVTFIRGVPIFVVFVGRLIHEIKNPMNNETWQAV